MLENFSLKGFSRFKGLKVDCMICLTMDNKNDGNSNNNNINIKLYSFTFPRCGDCRKKLRKTQKHNLIKRDK